MEEHNYHIHKENENKILIVIIITFITMIFEIVYGYTTKSMALLADGYHMLAHALMLFITYVTYVLSRKLDDNLFKSGKDKIGTLGAYTSSLFLALTAIWIMFEGLSRFFNPLDIKYGEAIFVATFGLIVNLICIFVMEGSHKHHHQKGDYNFLAAYYHILSDALTSILAIVALLFAKYFGISCLDPIIGILGGILVLRWAINLLKGTIKILIDLK